MKKILMILVAIIGLGLNTNAQNTCKIAGTADGTVVASVSEWNVEKGTVTIDFPNDSEKFVNVTFTLGGGCPGTVLVPPQSSTTKTVSCPNAARNNFGVSITGARCKQ